MLVDLYKEVPIPETPSLPVTPVPYPALTTYEVVLIGGIKLEPGETLYASTQNAEAFNIIAEGLSWSYPSTLPPSCCNFLQESANTGVAVIPDDAIVYPIFTAGPSAYGSLVKLVTIKAMQNTYEGIVSIYVSPDGKTWSLMREEWIPQSAPSAYYPSFKQVIDLNFSLQAGYMLGATSMNVESFAIIAEGVDWTYPSFADIISRTITIDHTQCGSSDSTSFPVLVSLNDTTLMTVANGGHVANNNGYDIMFFSDSGETSLLNWEIELYDGTTGTLIAWVNIPTVSNTTDTVFYMQYGNSTINTFQGGASGSAWNSNYKGVYHFPDGSVLSAVDSTANAYNGTITNAVAAVGVIDGAASFNGTDAYITLSVQLFNGLSAGTFEGWFNPSALPSGESVLCYEDGGGHNAFNIEFDGSGNPVRVNLGSNTFIDSSYTSWATGTWYHIVLTFDGTNVIFYVNGGLDISYTNSSVPGTSVRNTNFGSVYDPSFIYYYDGIMDEVRISNIARTADWVLTEYNNQYDPGNIGSAGFLTIGNEY